MEKKKSLFFIPTSILIMLALFAFFSLIFIGYAYLCLESLFTGTILVYGLPVPAGSAEYQQERVTMRCILLFSALADAIIALACVWFACRRIRAKKKQVSSSLAEEQQK